MRGSKRQAFTLVEMLVVVAVILLLVALLLPALQRADAVASRIKCLSNLKQITHAWVLYAGDYTGRMVGGWTDTPGAWVVGTANSVDTVINGLLYPYIQTPKVYQCPSDLTGHAWSYSVNIYMGGARPAEGATYYNAQLLRLSHCARPSKTWIFIEENDTRGRNINAFVPPNTGGGWVDLVGGFHPPGDNLAFADGHAEAWRWEDLRTWQWKGQPGGCTGCGYSTPNNPDAVLLYQTGITW